MDNSNNLGKYLHKSKATEKIKASNASVDKRKSADQKQDKAMKVQNPATGGVRG